MEGTVHCSIENGLGVISFYHPKSNSMPSHQLSLLAETIGSVARDPQVLVILLKSEGDKAFCAGANFDELLAIEHEEDGRKFFMGFANVINAMRKAPKMVICRVQGKCVGGGVGIAAAADYTIATENAEIKLSELAVGLGPFVVGPAVERKIGLSAFSQLTINATSFQSAQWAFDKGLFAAICPTIKALDETVHELVSKLLASNPEAMRALKQVFWEGTEHWDNLLSERADISGKLVLSEHTRTFIQGRKTS